MWTLFVSVFVLSIVVIRNGNILYHLIRAKDADGVKEFIRAYRLVHSHFRTSDSPVSLTYYYLALEKFLVCQMRHARNFYLRSLLTDNENFSSHWRYARALSVFLLAFFQLNGRVVDRYARALSVFLLAFFQLNMPRRQSIRLCAVCFFF